MSISSTNTTRTAEDLPESSIPIFTTVAAYREWRNEAFRAGKTVGFVPTMGALHDGHISLVRKSLEDNDLTVVSIFVNPAQFAPHEDLTTYPRTLPTDLHLLETQKVVVSPSNTSASTSVENGISNETVTTRSPSALFLPSVGEMYPSGIVLNVSEQRGTFVEVRGYGHQMEGKTRPNFFRGVATVVTKLFNVIQPTNAYFGQKDIQQALLLKRMSRDLLLSHPSPSHLHILPTARDPTDELALSSRNAYLTTHGRAVASTLRQALKAAKKAWVEEKMKEECIKAAVDVVEERKREAKQKGLEVRMKLDYIEMNDAVTFDVLEDGVRAVAGDEHRQRGTVPVILSGALYVDDTRLIDNILLGDVNRVL